MNNSIYKNSLKTKSVKWGINDLSLWFLLFSNIVTIFFAVTENWNLLTIMWIYWFQSIIIGFFHFIRILQLKEFSTEGFEINGKLAQPTQGTKIFTAFFFFFHYGFFHLLYMGFFLVGTFMKTPDILTKVYENVPNRSVDTFTKAYGNVPDFIELKYILLTALLFFINHLFSYLYNKPKDIKRQNIGSLLFYPYARIIPMHLTIIFGSIFGGALFVFLVLKTFADLIMHIVEHNALGKPDELKKQ